jgi:chromosome segregation ATPase
VQELSSRCQELQQQLDALKADHTAAEERLKATEQAAGTAATAARRELQGCEALLGPVLRQLQLGPQLPHSSRELQQLLDKVQQAVDTLPSR